MNEIEDIERRAIEIYQASSNLLGDAALSPDVRVMAEAARTSVRYLAHCVKLGDEFQAARALALAEMAIGAAEGWRHFWDLWPDAERGASTLRSARRGHEAVHGTADEKRARWQRLAEDFRRELERGTGRDAAYFWVAEKYGVSDRTVRRAVKRVGQIA